jgi:hypothetical protein
MAGSEGWVGLGRRGLVTRRVGGAIPVVWLQADHGDADGEDTRSRRAGSQDTRREKRLAKEAGLRGHLRDEGE